MSTQRTKLLAQLRALRTEVAAIAAERRQAEAAEAAVRREIAAVIGPGLEEHMWGTDPAWRARFSGMVAQRAARTA